ncbi:carboxylate-amine ligase [Pseudokineococcus sp. 1T1Z-3]|uniref:carboxylate-amine ligase n=1 Tax=Pseudokineococcus sp. 1T1Z-3 TaxID=3132745 RepID=UPI0030A47594
MSEQQVTASTAPTLAPPASVGEACHIGVEEEFHVVDVRSGQLCDRAGDILERLGESPTYKAELLRSSLETNSAVHRTLEQLRRDLVAARAAVNAEAAHGGWALVAAGTTPLADPAEVGVVAHPRNDRMRDEFKVLVDEQMICGLQVQVDCLDRSAAVAVLGRLRPWLPVLMALSASSPYWCGRDTGYASFRSQLWRRWPTSGPPPVMDSEEEYDELVAALVASGTMADRGMLYFDVRPQHNYPTLEVRLCDSAPLVDDVLLVTALSRALVRRSLAEHEAGVPTVRPYTPREVVDAARWRAARSGLEGDLLHPTAWDPRPARDVVGVLVDLVRDELDAEGDLALTEHLVDEAFARGSSAARQRAAFERRGSLRDVVDVLVEETQREGTPS